MTETQDRLAQLQARRAGGAAPGTGAAAATGRVPAARRAPATGSKIAAAGLGMTAMLGLVGAMAMAQDNGSSSPQPAQPAAPAQVVVVIHRTDGTVQTAGTQTAGTQTAGTQTAPGTVGASATPIQLAAQPVVQQAPAQAPAAKTSGSR